MRLALVLLLVPSLATAAPPSFEVKDRGEAVEVIAHNTKAAHTAIIPTRSRLEVEIVNPVYVPGLNAPDKLIKVVELDSNKLSIKTIFDRADVKTLSRFAQAIQVGEDLHVLFPRVVPASENAVVNLPEPTLPPELAAKIGPKPAPETKPGPVAKPSPAPIAKAPVVEEQPKAVAALNQQPNQQNQQPQQIGMPESDDATSKLTMYGALGLGAVGIGWWMLRKRKATQGPLSSIDVIAQRSLGGKAKVVWLAAGEREMVVAVTPQNVRVLGQWERGQTQSQNAFGVTDEASPQQAELAPAIAMPRAQTRSGMPRATTRAATNAGTNTTGSYVGRLPRATTNNDLPAERPSDSAVAGILRLRAKTQGPVAPLAVNDDVASDDAEADSLWAREILAATAGRK
jgi:flagellar biogenesis protein FliO